MSQSNAPTIELSPGTYQLTLGQLQLGAGTVQGAGPGGSGGTTIEQTDGQDRVIEVQSGPAKLAGVEITGGHLAPAWTSGTTWMGGGILAEGPLILQNTLVTGNEIAAPGGPSAGDAGDNAEGGGIDYIVGSGAGSTISNSTISWGQCAGRRRRSKWGGRRQCLRWGHRLRGKWPAARPKQHGFRRQRHGRSGRRGRQHGRVGRFF